MFQRIWQWLKQLWRRWVARQPPPAPTRQPPSDAESESVFMQLLQEVASGSTRGEIQGFLIIQQGKKHVTEADLVAWLRRASSSWLASPAQHQELGRRMARLGDIYKGELAEVARDISRQLAERNLGQLTAENQDLEIGDHPQPPLKSGEEEREQKIEVDIYELPEVAKLMQLLGTTTNTPSVPSNHTSTTPTNQPSVTHPPTINPEAATLFNQGVDLYYAGNVLGALALFERAVAIDSNYVYAWNGLGATLRDVQRYEEAIAAYERALAIDPNSHVAWYNLGIALSNVQRYEEAIAAYERTLAIAPNFHVAWNNLGNVLRDVQRYDEAIAAFERALAIDSNYVNAWNGLGNVLKDLQRYEEAIAAYERAVAIDPNYHFAWYNLGNALKDVQGYEKAIAAYERALAIDPNFHVAWNELGIALSNVQRHEEAIAAYERAVAIDSNYHFAWNGLGIALKDLQRYEEAIAAYERAVAIDPNFHLAWYNLGNALKDVQGYEEAIAAYERALAIDPNFHVAWNELGIALSNVQRYEEAIAAYERTLAIAPNFHVAWNNLGIALINVQRYEEAIEKFDRALQITKDQFWMAWANRGSAFFLSNRYDLAIQNWDDGISKYLQTNPDWKVAHGRLYQQKGRAQYLHGRQTTQYFPYFLEAKTSYQKALEFLDRPNEQRLEVLQQAIPVFRALGDAAASECLNQGIEILQDLISAASLPAHKLRLERQFSSFYQLEVDNLVQSGNFPLALTQAEKRKNYCLRWLREGRIENLEDSPTCEQIHQLLNPGTAIIYWHISPAAITTFILRQNQPLHAQIFTEDLTSIGADKELYKFETWLKEWKTDYQNYCETLKTEGTEKKSEALIFKQNLGDLPSPENHPWRAKMPERLNKLAEILHIPQILTAVGNNITQIILIPHRDLHLLPLESLFYQTLEAKGNLPAITRLPSAQIGINLQPLQLTAEKHLLNVETPSPILFAEIESAVIDQLYHPHLTTIPNYSATKQQITAAITAETNCFHFTGHGYHNLDFPSESALILANKEQLTVQEIFNLNFQGYHLVSLSACETGITSKKDISDEYVGLVSGFLAVGVARVVSTLWTVEEISAALMMIKFHQLFKDGIPPAEALKQAKYWLRTITYAKLAEWYLQNAAIVASFNRNCRRDLEDEAERIKGDRAKIESTEPPYAHPYYWAGFTITGKANY